MEQQLYELPEGWEWRPLGSATEVLGGGTPKTKISEYWNGGITWLSPTDLPPIGEITHISESIKKISETGLAKSSARLLPAGSVVFSSRATIGKIAITDCPLATNQGFTNFICPDNLLNRYLAYVLVFLTPSIASLSNSTTFREVSKTNIKGVKIPLPPLNEQKRIVAKLDALFTRIDTATTHLQQTLELSKALFASALDSSLVPTGDIKNPPKKWSCETLGAVSNLVSDGTHHSPKEQFNQKQDGSFKYVTSKNIKFDGMKLDGVTYIRKEVHDEIYARCNPEYLDQLITKDGAMTGTCCLNTLDEPFSLLSSVALVKLKRELMLPHFLNYFLRSPAGQEFLIGDISGAAITRTNLRKLKAIIVPLPPMEEQQNIVTHLDVLSERTRALEAATQEKLNDLTALKASLLDAAFKGQL